MDQDYDSEWDADWYDADDYDDDPGCTWCGGDGWTDCSDPLAGCWAKCDGEWCPCRACRGTGRREHQVVF